MQRTKAPSSSRRVASTSQSSQMHGGPGEVRIISGQWKGRKLPVLDVQGLRPTTDRVKETLFNWLMQDVAGRHVLDCFSGSGSLAFEALSRHAASALLIELDAKAAKQLQQNLARIQCMTATVVNSSCLSYLNKPATRQFDLVFLDPPFRQGLLIPACQHLAQHGWLAADALVYIEAEKELALTDLPENWRLLKEKVAGQLAYRLFIVDGQV
ncbi:MAG TPA: 16S rRNA (guanine(966)-N(2))-methyltransferase RsmD [Rheinheimera sp.]|nr:16S rRNA (guanine(966)-N(2))-methyltransferase RsmD [Rheinheimera sp.]